MNKTETVLFHEWAPHQALDSMDSILMCGLDAKLIGAVRQYTDSSIVVYEPDESLIHEQIEHVDISKNHLQIATTLHAFERLAFESMTINGKSQRLDFCQPLPKYNGFDEALEEAVNRAHTNKLTLWMKSRMWVHSMVKSLPYFDGAHSAWRLRSIIKGATGIVVGAGPSLDKNIADLKKHKGKSVIVAVNSSFMPCINAGVIPDFVVVMDSAECVADQLDPEHTSETRLICGTHAPARVHELDWLDRVIAVNALGDPTAWLLEAIGDEGHISAGGSVATLACAFLEAIGCSRLVLTGCDCALTGDRLHASGSGLDYDVVRTEDDHIRFEGEEKPGEQWTQIKVEPIEVDGWGGGKVTTTRGLLNFQKWFCQASAHLMLANVELINANEGGAALRNWQEMKLSDVEPGKPVDLASVFANLDAERIDGERIKSYLESYLESIEPVMDHVAQASKHASAWKDADEQMSDIIKDSSLLDSVLKTRAVEVQEREQPHRAIAMYEAIEKELMSKDGIVSIIKEAIERI